MSVVQQKRLHREKRRKRVRRKVAGTAERPRLSVYRSNVHIYAQLVDDAAGHTLAAADSRGVGDRKSTRLNSSHANTSYAVFCLKKKKANHERQGVSRRGEH